MIQSPPLNPGQRVGPFEIVSLLGRGGMGEVFLATDTRLDRKVAIKILPCELSTNSSLKQRFEREAKMPLARDLAEKSRVAEILKMFNGEM